MKKFFKIFFVTLGIVVFLLLAAIVVIPIAFKGQIMAIVKEQINQNVNAKVDFADFRLNLIRSFPNLNMSLDRMYVAGVGDFEGDTLVSFENFNASVALLSYFQGQGVVIRSVLLDRPSVYARVLPDGKANWDIARESVDTITTVDTTATEMPNLQVKLKKFEIRDADIVYNDESMNLLASIGNLDFLMSGDMTKDITTLNLTTTIAALDVTYDKIRYLKQATAGFQAGIGADIKNMVFTFKDNEFTLNDLSLGFDGKVSMPADNIDMDLTFATKKTSFKSLLSLVPAIYMQDFKSVKTDGHLALSGYVKGTYSDADSTLPNVGLDLVVEKARFQYPDLPKSVENVNINTRVFVDGTNLDKTTIDVNTFHMELGTNPFDAFLSVRTPMSDPDVKGRMKGTIDLSSFADVVPMKDVSLAGLMKMDLDFGGKMSMIEKERYEDFKADGSVDLSAFSFNSPDVPKPVVIPVAHLQFSPKYVELDHFDLTMGSSDMHFTGRMENFIPYVFKSETVRGRFQFTSNLLNITELIPESAEDTTTVEEDTTALAVIEVPGNIDFELNSNLNKIVYGNMTIQHAIGTILVKDKKVLLKDMTMNTLGGNFGMMAEYNTQVKEKPRVSMNMDFKGIDIPSAYTSFVTVQKLAPLAKGLNGKVSTRLNFSSLLGQDFMPVISTISGAGNLQSSQVQIVSSEIFGKIQSALKLKSSLTNTLKDVSAKFSVKDGRISVEPFEIKIGPIKTIIGGDQGIDQTMNYLVKMAIPRSEFGEGANEMVNNLASQAAAKGLNIQPGEMVNVDVKVGGTFTNPKIELSLKESMQNAMQEAKQQVKEQVNAVVEQKKEEVQQKVDEETAKLKAEADKRAEEIITKATALRDETLQKAKTEKDNAYAEAARIEKDAKGNLTEQLKAKTKAEAIRKTADAAYKKTVDIANNEYQKALDLAEQERQKLK